MLGFSFENDQEGHEEGDQVTEVGGSSHKPGRETIKAYIPPVEFAQVEVGPEYELLDLNSFCHCCKGMASLMPDRADDLIDRIQEKPEKVLSLSSHP